MGEEKPEKKTLEERIKNMKNASIAVTVVATLVAAAGLAAGVYGVMQLRELNERMETTMTAEKLMRRPGLTFRQISRTYQGKNSLDSAIYDSAKILYDEGVRRFFIITTDSDFVKIAEYLNSETPSYIIGVGTKQASETLRSAYDEFLVYPPEIGRAHV